MGRPAQGPVDKSEGLGGRAGPELANLSVVGLDRYLKQNRHGQVSVVFCEPSAPPLRPCSSMLCCVDYMVLPASLCGDVVVSDIVLLRQMVHAHDCLRMRVKTVSTYVKKSSLPNSACDQAIAQNLRKRSSLAWLG